MARFNYKTKVDTKFLNPWKKYHNKMPAQKFNFNFAPAEEEDFDEEGEEEMFGVSTMDWRWP